MGDGVISIETVAPMPLAAVRRQVTAETLLEEVIRAPIWGLCEERGIPTLNQTVVIYHDHGEEMGLNRPGGVAADIGVLLEAPFEGDRTLQCVLTPAGRAVHARHYGHYELLPVIHADIRAWCANGGHCLAGVNWEHYWHWHEVPERRMTDVYYLLR